MLKKLLAIGILLTIAGSTIGFCCALFENAGKPWWYALIVINVVLAMYGVMYWSISTLVDSGDV